MDDDASETGLPVNRPNMHEDVEAALSLTRIMTARLEKVTDRFENAVAPFHRNFRQ